MEHDCKTCHAPYDPAEEGHDGECGTCTDNTAFQEFAAEHEAMWLGKHVMQAAHDESLLPPEHRHD